MARLGGDEFNVLIEGFPQADDALVVPQRMTDALSQPLILGEHHLCSRPSIVIARFPRDATDSAELLKCANMAMYFAKRYLSQEPQHFDELMNEAAVSMMNMENSSSDALKNDELSLNYQPQLHLSSDEINGFEVLLRWHNPYLDDVSPVDFIPIAEESGLIIPIGEWVLRGLSTGDAVDFQRFTSLSHSSKRVDGAICITRISTTRLDHYRGGPIRA